MMIMWRMRNAIIVTLSAIALFASASCADSSKLYYIKKVSISDFPTPPEGKARVVFFRPQTGMKGQSFFNIYDGDAVIGILPKNSFFVYDTEPGKHIFGGLYPPVQTDFLGADISAGKTYYVQCYARDMFFAYIMFLDAVKKGSDTMGTLKSVLPTLQYAIHTDANREDFTLKDSPSGKYILHKPGIKTFRIEFEQARNEWLSKANRPWLLSEDGL